MKNLSAFILFILLIGCNTNRYTAGVYFNCRAEKTAEPTSDRYMLIKKILERSVVAEKDVPDYKLIEDKRRIYISSEAYEYSSDSNTPGKKFELKYPEIPAEIGEVRFCIKSPKELLEIADQNKDFVYLRISGIRIENDEASLEISTHWQPQSGSRNVYLSGGGYRADYRKIKSGWVFSKIPYTWQS